ncbi:hypothetical protein U8607_05035 [Methylobacterium durans]|uniref:hypothetical protein n=1 Tax=Methylobacterium durans TaxID=2202825 RepID=UPI002AFEB796|nr:hypothetical protein [Methylobacterium durans]MEA1831442.1 hypothetical protein [Methylobacterium durans]
MIVALLALAVAMMIGGTASVIQGFPFVRLESGLAMVIAGATVASAGAVIAGLAAVADRIRRVERALALDAAVPAAPDFGALPRSGAPAFAGAGFPGAALPPDAFAPRAEPAAPDGPRGRPSLGLGAAAPLGGAAFGGLAAGAALSSVGVALPDLGTGPGRAAGAERRGAEPELPELELPEPELPLPEPEQTGDSGLSADRREPIVDAAPEPDDGIAPEDDLFASPEPAPHPAEDDIALRPALREEPVEGTAEEPAEGTAEERAEERAADAGRPAEADAAEAAPTSPAREIVGTHSSGGNTYVMYADGGIEAETPRGRYTFNSLDELKAFVDSGGEGQTRGAA